MSRYLLIALSILWSLCFTTSVQAQLEEGDASEFIEDVTYSDGTKVKPGEKMVKKWKIKNTGSVIWKGRILKAVKSTAGDKDLEGIEKTEVPETKPGETCIIEATLKAPERQGQYKVSFKVVDKDGKEYFPEKSGVYIDVTVE